MPDAELQRLWGLVLVEFNKQAAERYPNCPALCYVMQDMRHARTITAEGHGALIRDLHPFLQCRGFLHSAAIDTGAWPPDLYSENSLHRAEFRRRFVRWRAGLEIGGPLPWAEQQGGVR